MTGSTGFFQFRELERIPDMLNDISPMRKAAFDKTKIFIVPEYSDRSEHKTPTTGLDAKITCVLYLEDRRRRTPKRVDGAQLNEHQVRFIS